MASVKGKIAIVTGGASGIGRAAALILAREGACVMVTDIDEAGGKAVADALGDAAVFVRLDVTQEQDWIDGFAFAKQTFGGVHVLLNSAGIGWTQEVRLPEDA